MKYLSLLMIAVIVLFIGVDRLWHWRRPAKSVGAQETPIAPVAQSRSPLPSAPMGAIVRPSSVVVVPQLASSADPIVDDLIDPALIPIESVNFVGYVTPENALQSTIWAMRTGNVNQFIASLTEAGKLYMTKEFEGKDLNEITDIIKGQIRHIDMLNPDRQRYDEAGDLLFVLNSTESQGPRKTSRDEEIMRFTPVNGEWKYSVP